ncbi:single-stranded DNA-binding protein [Solwaraspora sp. WMMD1047]|uniref:single-stranded DNA-binding protein n=1 Tax=Solwaraspora sp. WMMD1047 TaxID=3016102 RepID=UPI0024180367|nr:single-stranded DNA-binding protein [Solwaraspora sp. WMMD1047]MDG4829078.1 single-stranded DNA-binding protein [Solwaraspora sp. WMMD1047]
MFDTYVTIVGNVLTAPEWRRTQSNAMVANFKVASTARRLDRESGQWVDGNSLRVRVNCWRKLAEGVAVSVGVGDPVVVFGRMYTRDWTDEAGNHRTLYEMEAVAVGHDLSRGRARFLRNRPNVTSIVEDAEADARVNGERTEPVPDHEVPARPDGRAFEDDFDLPVLPAGVREIERDSRVLLDRLPGEGDHDSDGPADVDLPGRIEAAEGGPVGTGSAGSEAAGDLAGEGLEGDGSDGSAGAEDGDGEAGGLPRRGRRARGRVPVPA